MLLTLLGSKFKVQPIPNPHFGDGCGTAAECQEKQDERRRKSGDPKISD